MVYLYRDLDPNFSLGAPNKRIVMGNESEEELYLGIYSAKHKKIGGNNRLLSR
jgi:hypothetical protein